MQHDAGHADSLREQALVALRLAGAGDRISEEDRSSLQDAESGATQDRYLEALHEEVAFIFAPDGSRNGYAERSLGKCKWRLFGPNHDSQSRGEIHLADKAQFDRWANSTTVTVDIDRVLREGGNVRSVVDRAIAIYRTP